MNVEITAADQQDVAQIVALHMSVFGSARHLGVLFGAPYLTRVYTAAVKDDGFIILKACVGGQIIGFASARLDGYHSVGISSINLAAIASFLRNFNTIFTIAMLRRLIGRQLAERKLRRLRKKPCAQAYITCVRADSRGSGIGSLLRNCIYRECRERGANYLYTGILTDNAPMLAISRRDGFREIFQDRIGSVVYLEKCLSMEGPARE